MFHKIIDFDSVITQSFSHKAIIVVPETVKIVMQDNNYVYIEGIRGQLIHRLHQSITMQLSMKNLTIYSKYYDSNIKALIGTHKSLIKNMITGVTLGFVKKLQLIGIGYRVSVKDNILNLIIGLSHAVNYKLPPDIEVQCLNQTEIILTGMDKQVVGQVAANIRSIRPPEPFKGKGIRYVDEIIRNKDAKKR